MWAELYETLTGRVDHPRNWPTVEAIDASLDGFESRYEFRLPDSYRSFVHQFGPGNLFGWFRLFVPFVDDDAKSRSLNIDEENEDWRGKKSFWPDAVDAETLRSVIFFADTGGGDTYVWDTRDVSDAPGFEYRVYEHDHDSYDELEVVADSFEEFIHDFCLKTMWVKLNEGATVYEDEPPRRPTYSSCWMRRRRMKKAGTKKSTAKKSVGASAKKSSPQVKPTARHAGARYFEYVDEKSSKFWEIVVEGCDVTTRYGRIGSKGRSTNKTRSDKEDAAAFVEKLIAEKIDKGYQEK